MERGFDLPGSLSVHEVGGAFCKKDYFANDGNWPNHPLLSGFLHNWFQYMFCNFHHTETEVLDIEELLIDTDNVESRLEEDDEEEDISRDELEDCNIKRNVDKAW